MSIRKHVSFMLYLFSSFDGIIINITTDILNESYTTANDELLQLAVLGVPFASIMQVNCQPERVW
jgi:hypothetical protein